MNITNVAWTRDHQHRQVLRLDLDGHPAHIISKQQVALTRRGLVKGVDYLASDWRGQVGHPFIHGQVEPGLTAWTWRLHRRPRRVCPLR